MALGRVFTKLLLGRAFSTERGRITLLGKISYLLFPSHALAITLQTLGNDIGEDFLIELGKKAATDANKEQTKTMGIQVKGQRALEGISAFLEFMGWGILDLSDIKVKEKRIAGSFTVKNNPVIEAAKELYGKKSKVCSFYQGIYNAHGSLVFGVKSDFREDKCLTKGDECCVFTGR